MDKPLPKWMLFACLLTFGFLWGCTVPAQKIAVETGHHPIGMIFWQLVIAVVLLTPVALIRGSKLVLDARHLRFFLFVALCGTIVPNSFSLIASFHLPGGVMALAIATVPVFSLMFAVLLRIEQIQARRLLGVLCGAVAVSLLIVPEASLPDPSKWLFVFVALIAPIAYGLEGNYLALSNPPATGPVATLLGASILGALICVPLVVALGAFINPVEIGMGRSEWALFASSALHVAAYLGYIWLVSRAGPVFTSQVAYIVTPAGVVLSAIVLGETHSPWLWASLAIMLLALTLVQPRRKKVAEAVAV
ncbi:DMT family transporter [Pseudahrensia aquimaris]|uniref:DMT family transporter n=1 Tax=Pseudahrensia aquimaris TaxID=744461 RepID=A0ABW3FH86_9HYPH